jgi:hypothetical protein
VLVGAVKAEGEGRREKGVPLVRGRRFADGAGGARWWVARSSRCVECSRVVLEAVQRRCVRWQKSKESGDCVVEIARVSHSAVERVAGEIATPDVDASSECRAAS